MSKYDQVNDIEIWLREAFAELGLPLAQADPHFFEIGGSSLTAIKLIAKVDASYGECALSPTDLFERPRLSMIAETIRANLRKPR